MRAKPFHEKISLPDYQPGKRIDFQNRPVIGHELTSLLRNHLPQTEVAIRCIDSRDARHGDISRERLISIIKKTGSDRHDKTQSFEGQANLESQEVSADLYCYTFDLRRDNNFMEEPVWDLYANTLHPDERCYSVWFDIVIAYNIDQLEKKDYALDPRTMQKGYDAFSFIECNSALLGILEITS